MGILKKHNPKGDLDLDKDELKERIEALTSEVYEYTKRLRAEGKRSLLIVLQGMDASGKDGLTRTLFEKVCPSWVKVSSFKKPTDEEFAHDFLWRIQKQLPEAGMIGIFNRSHYEDILVPTVYGYLDKKIVDQRYDQINQFEKYLEANGTKILKFYLNISYEKQEVKLMERVNTKEKHWKHSDGDWETRERWDDFMVAYEKVFKKCDEIPWHIIPCDKNDVKLVHAAEIVVNTLKEMDPKYPNLVSERFKPDYSKSKMGY
jgi:PPK2 family polyphosphate:nucleotide phosphotransferase